MSQAPEAWIEANHRHVAAAMRVVQARLDDALTRLEGKPAAGEAIAEAERALQDAADGMSPPPALERLRALFALTPFQYHLLVFAAAVELAGSIGRACATLHGDARRAHVSFGLALWVLPDAHWTALSPDGALRRWRLIEVGEGGFTEAPIRIDERILHEIVGASGIDNRVRGVARVGADEAPPLGHDGAIDEVARSLAAPSRPLLVVHRGSPESRVAVACAAVRRACGQALVIRTADVPASLERDLLVTLLQREAVLHGAGVVIEHAATDAAEHTAFARALAEVIGPAVVATDAPFTLRRPTVHVDLPALDAGGRRALWQHALGPAADGLNGVLDELISEFRPEPEEILRLGEEWKCRFWAGEDGHHDREHPLRYRLRADNRGRFKGLAQVIVPAAEPDDLVLPDAQAEMIRQIELHVRHRQTVLDDWGFARREARGLGIAALFHGPSGTGKTLAAEVIAKRLGFDLVRVDLSQVVSKYIGETEKNLSRIFDAADRGGSVLLFDEADAMFGKRSEVRDSHDRYANIEVGYLLQRIEAFRGLAVLTTNLKQSLDTAFLRRLRFVVAFSFPDVAERRKIWERALPAETPREGLDLDRVSRLQVTGGNIRNIALHAAFLAAAAHAPVRMEHLWRASRDECARIEKSVTAAEIGGWL